MGRPSIGVEILLGVRVSPEMLAEIEAWAATHKIKRSEAVRQLIAKGLKKN